MTDLDLTKLREIANAAHDAFERQDFVGMIDTGNTYRRALDPPTVLALIDEIERLRGALASSEYMRDVQRKDRAAQAFERLRAENERLRGVVEKVRELAEDLEPRCCGPERPGVECASDWRFIRQIRKAFGDPDE